MEAGLKVKIRIFSYVSMVIRIWRMFLFTDVYEFCHWQLLLYVSCYIFVLLITFSRVH